MCNRMPPHIPGYCPPTEPTACPFCDDPHCKGLSAHQVETIDDIAADRDRLVLQLAAAESRAREAEADAAAMREALRRVRINLIPSSLVDDDDWVWGHNAVIDTALTPHPGAPLLAELEAAREVVELARGEYRSNRLRDAITAYDAARGAR